MTPYIGEIRMFAGNFAPAGWLFCDGQLVSIAEFETLFTLIGTTYGGDGQETFAMPDLRGRLPLHMGNGYIIGQMSGTETVTLTVQQIPSHTHPVLATSQSATSLAPNNTVVPAQPIGQVYANLTPFGAMAPGVITPSGASQPHNNLQPFLGINFIISMYGIFPTQS
jgi:microcystin-dependent protein